MNPQVRDVKAETRYVPAMKSMTLPRIFTSALFALVLACSACFVFSESSSARLTSKVQIKIYTGITQNGQFFDLYLAEVQFNNRGIKKCFIDKYRGQVTTKWPSRNGFVCMASGRQIYTKHPRRIDVRLIKGSGKNAKTITFKNRLVSYDGTKAMTD